MMKQITGVDDMFFSLEAPNTPMHIGDIHTFPYGRNGLAARCRQLLRRFGADGGELS